MLFNSYPFLIFFLAVLVTYRAIPARHRVSLVLGASLLFYFLWIPQYLLLLLVDIGVNYALLRAMVRSSRPRRYLAAVLVFNLGLLGWFKYAAFIVSSIAAAWGIFEPVALPTPKILLPLGISFYTFMIIALAVDTYRGDIEPVKSLRDYAVFMCFFPHLIAGPILRGSEFLPQLRKVTGASPEQVRRGAWLIASGLVKKVLLADLLLAPFVNVVFGAPGFASAPEHLVAVYSFAFQIYFDFSGYTDIARGAALLLGFELPLNFEEPYLARDPAEFWRRWHMTLSRWLRDYLYVPLGGNRKGRARTLVNLMLTMLLGGLWHGAAWNFVIWGGFHGLLLVAHRLLAAGRRRAERPLRWSDALRIVLLFHAVCLLWIFFRANTFADASAVLHRLFTGTYTQTWPVLQIGIVALCAALHVLERPARVHLAVVRERLSGPWGAVIEGAAIGAVAGLVYLFGGVGGEFIYFQF
ncbi:MAG: MBOAT family O-acyltransferase [Deltaproteobacteria bacterium]|nr:MBOAT family O-acyltransferase [Deltaproteobacteria bacterium]